MGDKKNSKYVPWPKKKIKKKFKTAYVSRRRAARDLVRVAVIHKKTKNLFVLI